VKHTLGDSVRPGPSGRSATPNPTFMSLSLFAGTSRRILAGLGVALLCAAPTVAQNRAPARLNEARFDRAGLTLVQTDARTGAPTFLSGRLRDGHGETPEVAARAFLTDNAAVFGLGAADDVRVRDVTTDDLGLTHIRLQQTVGGVPVFGGDAYVHLDRQGAVYSYSGTLQPDAAALSTTPAVSEAVALASARIAVGVTAERAANELADWTPSAHLVVYPTESGLRLAYHARLYAERPFPANWEVFVDAQTGVVIEYWNAIHTVAGPAVPEHAALMPTPANGTGNSLYSGTLTIQTDYTGSTYRLLDATRASGGIRTRTANNGTSLPGSDVTSTTNSFTATAARAAVDAHWGAGQVYSYYLGTHGRNSYNNAGAALNSTVHYSSSYNNAYWDGVQMVYGDGNGTTFSPLVELDICAHELSHAVTERTAGLVYNREPGALNESVSDIFAVMVDRDDWWVGDRSYTPNTSGDALRYLDTPTRGGQPDLYANRLYPGTCTPSDANDYCGVHSNSGIPNHAAYLMAAGGTKSGVTVAAIGRADTERIWYRALTTYFTSSTNFASARTGTIQAATDLFGASSAQTTAVTNAWAAVGVGSGGGGGTDTFEPNGTVATAYGPLTSGTTYNSFIFSATDDDYYKVTVGATGTVAVTLGGAAGDYDLYLLNSAGTQVAASESGTSTESISYNATATGTYYIRVHGYNGVFSTTDDYQVRATTPTGGGGGAQWFYEARTFESAHNYTNNLNTTQTYSRPGATQVMVYFDRFELEANYDYVYLKDAGGTTRATYTGTKAAFWSTPITGSSVAINFRTDASVVGWGYRVSQVAYYANGQLIATEFPGGNGTPMDMPNSLPSDEVVTAAKALVTGLEGVRPNPASGSAALTFTLAEAGAARLVVLDVLGREVAVVTQGTLEAGRHEVALNANALPAGAYVVVLDAAGQRFTSRMTVTH